MAMAAVLWEFHANSGKDYLQIAICVLQTIMKGIEEPWTEDLISKISHIYEYIYIGVYTLSF